MQIVPLYAMKTVVVTDPRSGDRVERKRWSWVLGKAPATRIGASHTRLHPTNQVRPTRRHYFHKTGPRHEAHPKPVALPVPKKTWVDKVKGIFRRRREM